MGCISSKKDINDRHPNVFQVMNVDDQGNRLSPGQLEITETDLVLYQRKKAPVKWPLRCLRRYGFDADLFSFESGRRCPTGPGIYAFRCQRAEQLFNLLQTHIQVRNNTGEDAISREFSVSSAAPGPVVPSRVGVGDANYLEPSSLRTGIRSNAPANIRFISQNGGGPTRLSSVGSNSNGPLSPQGTASPSPPPVNTAPSIPSSNPSVYYANEELFTSAAPEPAEQQRAARQSYVNSDISAVDTTSKTICRLSVGSGDSTTPNNCNTETTNSCAQVISAPSYINIDLNSSGAGGPLSPTFSVEGESNYARLELSDSQQCHLYMNVIPGPENGVGAITSATVAAVAAVAGPAMEKPSSTSVIRPKQPALPSFGLQQPEWEVDEPRHCYANLDPGEIEVARSHVPKRLPGNERPSPLPLLNSATAIQSQQNPLTPPPGGIRTVNYIVLDLDQSKTSDSTSGANVSSSQQAAPPPPAPATATLPPESPRRASEGYATIDFNKTVALSHSVNPNVDNDSEGSRKTRHNSTINDLTANATRLSSSE